MSVVRCAANSRLVIHECRCSLGAGWLLRALTILLLSCSVSVHAKAYPSLWASQSPELQRRLEDLVASMRLTGAARNGRLALVIVDITDPDRPRVAAVNPDRMMYAASLPKIAILLAAFVEIERGALVPDDALWQDMTDMIRNSSNPAATRVLELVGRERVLEILQSQRFQFYDPEHNGGLWVGKDYARRSAYHRDPLHNLSHGASVMQVARFYYLLDTNRLVNPQLTRKMKEILSKPGLSHKFVKGLEGVADLQIYRKSGTWKHFHADSALVKIDERSFIIVGLAESRKGSQWLVKLARPLLDLVRN